MPCEHKVAALIWYITAALVRETLFFYYDTQNNPAEPKKKKKKAAQGHGAKMRIKICGGGGTCCDNEKAVETAPHVHPYQDSSDHLNGGQAS